MRLTPGHTDSGLRSSAPEPASTPAPSGAGVDRSAGQALRWGSKRMVRETPTRTVVPGMIVTDSFGGMS